MKNSNNVINMLLSYITSNDKFNENEKITLLFKTFFSKKDNDDIPNLNQLNITKFEIENSTEDNISILIELFETGLLVGKKGKTIKQLGGFLSKNLNKKVRINIKQTIKNNIELNVE